MTERVYLHVGAPKSGTTYLQAVLERNRAVLADAGVLVVGSRHIDRVHAGMVIREDPRLAKLGPGPAQAWDRLVREIHEWTGSTAVLSYELLAGASEEQARAALARLGGLETHVVITARDLAGAVPSAWQERLKFALTTPLEQWRPRPESDGPRAEWGWRTMDPAGVAARWGASLPPERVHLVTVPRSAPDPHLLWRRFASACGLERVLVDAAVGQPNESLGLRAAEVLRRVNERIGDRLPDNRAQATWLRDTLAHQVLAGLDREPIGLTADQLRDATEHAGDALTRIRAAGYHVVGDLEDVEARERHARLPGQVPDDELLPVALDALTDLLLLMRQRSLLETARPKPGGAAPPPQVAGRRRAKPVALAQRLLRAPAAARVEQETRRAEQRVAKLSLELQAARRLQLRVALLEDLVTELLVPADLRDDEAMVLALHRYREETLL